MTKAAKAVFDGGRGNFLLAVIFIICKCQCMFNIIENHADCDDTCLLLFTATFPLVKPLLDYYMLNYTNSVEPWKVLHHTALKLIEARKSGTAKPPKVRICYQPLSVAVLLWLEFGTVVPRTT